MIPIPPELDLGRDESRMKDRRDAERQTATVRMLLDRMYGEMPGPCSQLQLVADEVGMGKTFVALGLAYAVLSSLRSSARARDLAGTAPQILVIAPQNAALVSKWKREVGEFVKRCVEREHRDTANQFFRVSVAERVDELTQAISNGKPGVIITNTGVLSGGKKLMHYELKRRVLLGALFRFWGNRFQYEARARLLKGAPESWPRQPDGLSDVEESAASKTLPFTSEAEWVKRLRELEVADEQLKTAGREKEASELDALLEECKAIAEPYVRNRDERFGAVEKRLTNLYRRVCLISIKSDLPLVIVDEAHNWKNGPSARANGYDGFERYIAPHCRRLLMLTATPFQLRPEEMLELVKAGEVIVPSADPTESAERSKALQDLRQAVIGPVLTRSAARSRSFSKSWARLPTGCTERLAELWSTPQLEHARTKLSALALAPGVLDEGAVESVVAREAAHIEPPEVRDLVRDALRLYALNLDLSQELGAFVIRHRRNTEHRTVDVGAEYERNGDARAGRRVDSHVLHAALGIDVRGDAELPHYLLMRAVSELKQGRGRTSLGTALTGCYSTLLSSDEGRKLTTKLDAASAGARYFGLLKEMVGPDNDVDHPKVRAVTDRVMAAWRRGEKTLVFCFRTHTATRIRTILGARIEAEYTARLSALSLDEQGLRRIRNRFTQRDEALSTLLSDRVFWSLRWAAQSGDFPLPSLTAADLRLRDHELTEVAALALRANVDLRLPAPDRVFIHRATEHVLARRFLREKAKSGPLFRQVCTAMALESWITYPYGCEPDARALKAIPVKEEETEEPEAETHEGGAYAAYPLRAPAAADDVSSLAAALRERRTSAGVVSVLDAYADGPSLWLGSDPERCLASADRSARALQAIHGNLLRLTRQDATLEWAERFFAMDAIRRTVLARGFLVRFLPGDLDREHQSWSTTFVDGFFAVNAGQAETLAERIAVLAEDFQAAAGPTTNPEHSRHSLLDAAHSRRRSQAALVSGATPPMTRNRAFIGFNGPGLPDILVCTSVGAEGIDLHRQCRNVVHYDLAWNPAVIEQRTGRVDRIGSKTFRDRTRTSAEDTTPFLEVGVPFLAGTYDERMFEELRLRAQTFEVLTGGDVSAGNREGSDASDEAEGSEEGLQLPALPPVMIDDLRVKLHVWADSR